jgi:hypothetical protein
MKISKYRNGRNLEGSGYAYYPGICMEGLRKTAKILIQDDLCHMERNPQQESDSLIAGK